MDKTNNMNETLLNTTKTGDKNKDKHSKSNILKLDIEELKLKSSLSPTDELEISIKARNDSLKFRICTEGCMNNFLNKSISSTELLCLRTCAAKLNEVEKVIDKFLSSKLGGH